MIIVERRLMPGRCRVVLPPCARHSSAGSSAFPGFLVFAGQVDFGCTAAVEVLPFHASLCDPQRVVFDGGGAALLRRSVCELPEKETWVPGGPLVWCDRSALSCFPELRASRPTAALTSTGPRAALVERGEPRVAANLLGVLGGLVTRAEALRRRGPAGLVIRS